MKKQNQTGIAHLAAIIIVLVITGVSFAGWRVYELNKDNKDLKQKTNNSGQVQEQDPEQEPSLTGKTYTHNNPKFSFAYMQGWTVGTLTEGSYEYLTISSPDFKEELKDDDYCKAKLTGTRFIISYIQEYADPNVVAKTLDGDGAGYTKNQKKATLGGVDAVEYDGTPGECGYWHVVKAYNNGYEISIMSYLGEKDFEKYEPEYQKIVASFKF